MRKTLLGLEAIPACYNSRARRFRISIAGARLTRRFLETLIDGAKPVDIITSVGLAMFLVLVASVSIYAASRPTTTVDIVAIWRAD